MLISQLLLFTTTVKPFGRAYGTEFGNGEIITTTVHANNRYRWRQAARENQLDSNRSFVLTLSGGFVDDKLRLRVISSPRCVFITISESECATWISKYLRKFETIRILSQTGLTVFNHGLFPVANASFAWSFILNYYILGAILIIIKIWFLFSIRNILKLKI